MSIRYDCTAHGVMVQVHLGDPTDAEWTAMLDFMLARKDTIRAVLAIAHGETGPSSKQRAELADALKRMKSQLPFALLTNSSITRGILTAINWLTRKQDESRAFPLGGLEPALSFFGLSAEEKAVVRSLASSLGAGRSSTRMRAASS